LASICNQLLVAFAGYRLLVTLLKQEAAGLATQKAIAWLVYTTGVAGMRCKQDNNKAV